MFKHLASIFFIIFLSLLPVFAMADGGKVSLIDLPNVAKDNAAHTLTNAVHQTLTEAGYTVFNQESMTAEAKKAGVDGNYWESETKIAQVNQNTNHHVVIVTELHPNKKPYMAVAVYEASTGKQLGTYKQKLKKKNRLSKDEKADLLKHLESFFKSVKATESSSQELTKRSDTTQSSKDNEQVSQDTKDEPHEKLTHGAGRPVFLIAANFNPGIHNFKFKDDTKLPLSHKSAVYPVFGIDFVFFPCPLFSSVDYLQGLGIQFGFGFAKPKLDTTFNYNKNMNIETDCKMDETNHTYTCPAMQYRIQADLVYRLLLQKTSEGKLNPNGMSLDFLAGFHLMNHVLDKNPGYEGNNYYGVIVGLGFSTPLGVDRVRLSLGASFIANLNKESTDILKKYGKERNLSLGTKASADIMFDIYKGLFLHGGYQLVYMHSTYNGSGCNNDTCSRPENSVIDDFFHEVILGLGYMLY